MGEEGGHMDPGQIPTKADIQGPSISVDVRRADSNATTDVDRVSRTSVDIPLSPRNFQNPFSRAHTTLDMDDYFV
jgi:hypothetical protein